MPENYQISNQHGNYFLTFQVVGWVDIFTRKVYKDIIVNAFNYCIENKNLQVHAWVIMSNHVRCILSSKTGKLSDTVAGFKRHTAKMMFQALQNEKPGRKKWILSIFQDASQVWTDKNHAIEILPEFAADKIKYIHYLPVKASIVGNEADYIYSSARDYKGKKGLVNVTLI